MPSTYEPLYESSKVKVVMTRYVFSEIPIHIEVYEKRESGQWLQVMDKPIMETSIKKSKG